mgnify:CR=1 FL=1
MQTTTTGSGLDGLALNVRLLTATIGFFRSIINRIIAYSRNFLSFYYIYLSLDDFFPDLITLIPRTILNLTGPKNILNPFIHNPRSYIH